MDIVSKLYDVAMRGRENAYAPYSGFSVGAALLAQSGRIYAGCNVENSSYGLTICAERVALCSAVAQGERVFEMMIICADSIVPPCGACLQVMAEFGDMEIISFDMEGKFQRNRLSELLPQSFRLPK
ncbi:cytidine deaminase [Acetomicrobium thermoterrenum DSM 13490]|jgi:cytidine deaminase|uniref:Cytidine deaminase n=1 Tax=Acetomicrobium thermoterrenum DSM 13490 TaxID=1120987 RepID=A0A1H3E8M1_9BACT|nr:cytidine deaminase [Acetomicrobium thermoterrenum]SDX74977.1 cytidine deaminase [Acetomicrobium thermoterrenum DSM 13490]